MRGNLAIGIVALMMLTVALPTVSANHLSVGAQDTVGTAAEESPSARSVAGTDIGADDDPYGVGTKTSDECYTVDPEISAEEAGAAATARGFCGMLYYNDGAGDLAGASPVDQVNNVPKKIGTFDVQRTWYNGPILFGASGCEPMCDSAGQDALWDLFHSTGSDLGITDGPEAADEGQDSRVQTRNVIVDHAHPAGILQRSAGVWDMNGWTAPAPLAESFVGFLYDSEGDPISDDDLKGIVSSMQGTNQLASDSVAQVCGWTPDRNFQSTGTQSFCEAPLLYLDADAGDGDVDFDQGYDDECASPTYVCGATTGGYWESEAAGLAGAYAGRYQGEYTRWHWVVAPNPPECANTEPGFDFDGDDEGLPFLAHDLDVYTPPQDLDAAESPVSTQESLDYARGTAAAGIGVPDLPGPLGDAADAGQEAADTALGPITRGDRLEPNNGDPISGLAENSQEAVIETRLPGDACSQLVSTEDPNLVDPWVNIADATVDASRSASFRDPVTDTRTPVELARDTPTVGVFGEDQDQDASNDPTPSLYSTEGFFGLFTDKDDDGEYEQVTGPSDSASLFGAGVYGEANIQATGAYPMLWDMHAAVEGGEAVVQSEEGCTFTGDRQFSDVMETAGYGPNTGLAQAIYLKEPTAFVDADAEDPKQVNYPGGNNIYVFLSDAARNLWDGDTSETNGFALDEQVDGLVDNLRSHVVANYDADETSLNVVQPGDEMGLESDFLSQCGESTGGFSGQLSFVHDCSLDCSGDTIATMYTFEATQDVLGGEDVPKLEINGDLWAIGQDQHTWIDVDPFDGDPDRNDDSTDRPPTGE